jgi:hypothetical protein
VTMNPVLGSGVREAIHGWRIWLEEPNGSLLNPKVDRERRSMKKNVSSGAIAVVLLAVLIVIGLAAWRMFAPDTPPPATPAARAAAQQIIDGLKAQAEQSAAAQQSGQAGAAPAAPRIPGAGKSSAQSQ